MPSLPPLEPKRPAITDELEVRELAEERLIGLRVSECELGGDLSERAAADLRLQDVRLASLDLTGTEAPGLTIVDAIVAGGSWANLRAARGTLTRVETGELRATGVDLTEAALKDVVFADARLDLASFRFAKLERIVFRDCRLEEVDFLGASLRSVRFERSNLTGASFVDATCERTELRDCELVDLQGVEGLRGVRMPWNEVIQVAGQLAAAAGITVLD
jgi:uncharacterized protein YjbI with pentapeptide repeats